MLVSWNRHKIKTAKPQSKVTGSYIKKRVYDIKSRKNEKATIARFEETFAAQ